MSKHRNSCKMEIRLGLANSDNIQFHLAVEKKKPSKYILSGINAALKLFTDELRIDF